MLQSTQLFLGFCLSTHPPTKRERIIKMLESSITGSIASELAVQAYQQESDRPQLWVKKENGAFAARHADDFDLRVIEQDSPSPGMYHIIASDEEREIRRCIRKLQSVPCQEIRIYSAQTLPFALATDIFLTSFYLENWLKSQAELPLSLKDALDIAEDILSDDAIPTKQRNIELEELRGRCGTESSFDWNKYIADLERDIHADVDGKT